MSTVQKTVQKTTQLAAKWETPLEEPVTVAIKVACPPLDSHDLLELSTVLEGAMSEIEDLLERAFTRRQPTLDGIRDVLGDGVESMTISAGGRSTTITGRSEA